MVVVMSHASKSHASLEIDHDPNSTTDTTDSTSRRQHDVKMAQPSGLFDSDTKVYYAKKYRQLWASGPASMVSVLAGAPFENVKTRMQSRYFPNAWVAFTYTYRTEGVRGFWVGTWAPLVTVTANRIAGFLIYRQAKYGIDSHIIKPVTGESAIQYSNDNQNYPNLMTNLCFVPAGMISGAATTIFLTPVELLKNAAQTSVLMAQKGGAHEAGFKSAAERRADRVGSYAAAKRIVQNRGFGALWTGFRLHLMRDTVGSGVYFGVYEGSKQAIGTYFQIEHVNASWAAAAAGGLAGLLSWTATYPIDTSKTRAQNNLLGVPSTSAKPNTSDILDTTGKVISRSSKWKGIEMIIIRSVIQNMIQMTAFERVKIWIDGMTFKDGSKTLPYIVRERGKDQKIRSKPRDSS